MTTTIDLSKNYPELDKLINSQEYKNYQTMTQPTKQPNGNKRKGFASMTKEKRKEVATKGANARVALGRAGLAPSMQEIGRKGGKAPKTKKNK